MHIVLLGDSIFDNAPYTAGGPAVIEHVGLLNERVRTVGEGLAFIGKAVDSFSESYRSLLDQLVPDLGWLQLCTVYNGDFGPEAPVVRAAIRLFNDAIQRAANEHGVEVIELRDLLNEPAHYANPIEPSVEGGRILAEEILRRARSCNR